MKASELHRTGYQIGVDKLVLVDSGLAWWLRYAKCWRLFSWFRISQEISHNALPTRPDIATPGGSAFASKIGTDFDAGRVRTGAIRGGWGWDVMTVHGNPRKSIEIHGCFFVSNLSNPVNGVKHPNDIDSWFMFELKEVVLLHAFCSWSAWSRVEKLCLYKCVQNVRWQGSQPRFFKWATVRCTTWGHPLFLFLMFHG